MRLRVELPLLATIAATAANTTSTAAVAAAAKRVELLGQDTCISLSFSFPVLRRTLACHRRGCWRRRAKERERQAVIYSCGKSPFLLLSPAPVSLSLSVCVALWRLPCFPDPACLPASTSVSLPGLACQRSRRACSQHVVHASSDSRSLSLSPRIPLCLLCYCNYCFCCCCY